jgi:hypothetical protein
MKVNGMQMRKKMEEVFKCGLMGLFMKDTGKTIKQMEEVV